MLRRLGEGLNRINTNGSTNSSIASSPSPLTPTNEGEPSSSAVASATNATKRALQSFGQLAYSKTSRSNKSDEALSLSVSSSGPAGSVSPSLNPPTPPRKDAQGVSSSDAADWDSIQLPFSSSQNSSSPAANDIATNSVPVPSGLVLPTAYAMNASGLVDLKDEMMMELLSSDALLYAGNFEILSFEQLDELRKEHTLLINRLNMLTNKVAVETKIRDASLSISRLYTSKRLSRQADDQIETANRKVEAATAELNRIAKREADVRTRILRHMAAVLGLMLRRVETSTNGAQLQATLTPLPAGSDRDLLSPRTPFSPAFSTSTSSTSRGVTKFEGPHLYAGHKDATFPMHRSPVGSPQMPAGLFSSMPPSSNGHDLAMARAPSTHSTALNYLSSSTTALDSQIAELASQLEAAQLAIREQEAAVKALTEERDAALRRLRDSEREEQENRSTQKRESEVREELKDVRSLLDKADARVRQQEQELHKREEETRRLQAAYERDQTDMLDKLRSTLELHSDGQLGHLMPDTTRLSASSFVSRNLPDLLKHVGTEHERALQENEHLREQVHQFEQASSSLNNRSEEEIKGYKRQLEIQQQEKQVLLKKISRIEGENVDLKKSIQQLEKEVEEQTRLANSGAEESERNIQEAQAFFSQRLQAAEQALAAKTQEGEQEKRSLRGRLENLQGDLQQIRADKIAMGDSLKGIWQRLPTDAALQNRLALSDSDDASRYRAAYAPRQEADRTSFSLERFALRLGNFLSSADKLFDRFNLQEEQTSTHRNAVEQAQTLLEKSQGDLQRAESQKQELNQRIENAQRREADLLQSANELQAALDTSRTMAKRSESSIRELESRCAALEQEKLALKGNQADKARLSAMEKELDEVREELATAQDELDEVKSKESRQRIQMLDELTTLTEEASSLRTQLRAAQRKLTAAGKS